MQISMDKKYRTRNGKAVRIFCTDLKGDFTVAGAILYEDADAIDRWTSSGSYDFGKSESGFDLIEVSPYEDFKIDEPVMVRDNEQDSWKRRYFSHEKDGVAFTFHLGATSWSSYGRTMYPWMQCRRPAPEELAG